MTRGVRIVLSVDMKGISQIGDLDETLACRAEYWATGKPRMEAETAGAAEGLLAAGATEGIVLDNHGSGNPESVSPDCLPAGARLVSESHGRAWAGVCPCSASWATTGKA
jgi:D-aminopeptidase